MNTETIIIGAGACGLMCAAQAGYLGKKVLLLEKNEKPGAKILISGGGRCNYTNKYASSDNFISGNEHFSKSAFARWTVQDTIQFFESYGIEGKEKTLGQLFPVTNNARDIVKVFTGICEDFGQEIRCNTEVRKVEKAAEGFVLDVISNGKEEQLHCEKLVVAAGGLPIPKMGATDIGLQIARSFGIAVTKTAPALVPLVIGYQDREWYEQLSGTSVFTRVSNDQISFEENILFTHWGLSGPAILQISSYWKPGETITIDFLPNQDILQMIETDRLQNGKRMLGNYLAIFLPKRIAEAMGIYLPLETNLASLSKAEIERTAEVIHRFQATPAGDKGYEKAEVMRGGVDTNELSSKTLEAKKVPGLFFGGECVDVTGWLGGYNFQWAWASGYVIAQQL